MRISLLAFWTVSFDWLRKSVTARVTAIQLLPVRKPRQIVSVIRRCEERVRCEAKGNFSDGIKDLAILLKGKYSFHFVHNIAARGLLVFELFFLKC